MHTLHELCWQEGLQADVFKAQDARPSYVRMALCCFESAWLHERLQFLLQMLNVGRSFPTAFKIAYRTAELVIIYAGATRVCEQLSCMFAAILVTGTWIVR